MCTSERLPWQLFTVEALAAARERLAPGGILAVQFIGDDGPWTASLALTARQAFGGATVLGPRFSFAPVAPCLLLASVTPLPPVPDDPAAPWRVIRPVAGGALLTDEHFPAERDWARVAAAWRRSRAEP